MVGKRKHSSAAFRFQGKPARGEEIHTTLRRKRIRRAVQKFSAVYHVLQKFRGRKIVRQIAPAFSRDINFFAEFLVFFHENHVVSVFRGNARRHQPGRASAHNAYFFQCRFVLFGAGAPF